MQEQSNARVYSHKIISTGNPLIMNKGTSPPKEAGFSTSVPKVSASSLKDPVNNYTASIIDSLEDHSADNVDLQNTGPANTPDDLQQNSDSVNKHVKVSLYQMLLGNYTCFIYVCCISYVCFH